MALTFANGNAVPADSIASDSLAIDTAAINGEVAALTGDMQAKLEAKDSKGLTEIVESAKQKIDELVSEGKVEEAKAYASQVKQFIDNNAETIKQVTNGDATISSIVSAISSLPTNAENAVDAAGDAVKADAENAVQSAKDAAENKANEVKDAAKQTVDNAKAAAKQKANEEVDKAVNKANEEVNKAANKALNKLGL